ncbi:hypothetical protein LZ31DRAFT_242807 [Colletotrichum somersetense]|nr:hypothetical protein LZ31DRAFT_242807 [Colletotrichum somersetense]
MRRQHASTAVCEVRLWLARSPSWLSSACRTRRMRIGRSAPPAWTRTPVGFSFPDIRDTQLFPKDAPFLGSNMYPEMGRGFAPPRTHILRCTVISAGIWEPKKTRGGISTAASHEFLPSSETSQRAKQVLCLVPMSTELAHCLTAAAPLAYLPRGELDVPPCGFLILGTTVELGVLPPSGCKLTPRLLPSEAASERRLCPAAPAKRG